MSSALSAKVNQHVASARFLLKEYHRVLECGGVPYQQHALLESSCFQLYNALQIYHREIAQSHGLEIAEPHSLEALRDSFQKAGQPSPETNELHELSLSSNSWLSCLDRAYKGILKGHAATGATTADSRSDHAYIAVQTIACDDLNAVNVDAWLDKIAALLSRQRETMRES